jgi:hypothetical protein
MDIVSKKGNNVSNASSEKGVASPNYHTYHAWEPFTKRDEIVAPVAAFCPSYSFVVDGGNRVRRGDDSNQCFMHHCM